MFPHIAPDGKSSTGSLIIETANSMLKWSSGKAHRAADKNGKTKPGFLTAIPHSDHLLGG